MEEEKEVEVHLPDALHDEHAGLPADALVQQPDERAQHGVVVAPVHNLDSEHVESPDQLAALRQLGHPRLLPWPAGGGAGDQPVDPALHAPRRQRLHQLHPRCLRLQKEPHQQQNFQIISWTVLLQYMAVD